MVLRIDTVDQWQSVRPLLADKGCEGIASKENGRIPVPCIQVLLVCRELVQANVYNPNSVPRDKMELLRQSILDNGFCFPVVTIWDEDLQRFVIIDGFHRATILGPDWLDCDRVPIVVLAHDVSRRMAATMQFNKARGVHQVDLDAEIIRALLQQGLSEPEIAQRVGLDLEAVHRYKQLTGIAELFKNADWSMAWEVGEA